MIQFFKGIKRAADFFKINPDGLSFVTERRLKDLSDRNFTSIMNLEYDIYELKETIKTLQNTLDKEQVPTQLVLPAEQAKTFRKPKAVKLKPVEEEVKAVKSTLTQAQVKRLFEYRNGELYWKVDHGKSKKGDKAGYIHATKKGYHKRKFVSVYQKIHSFPRIVFLMFQGYLPDVVSFIDRNPLNTRIENLIAVTYSQMICRNKIRKDNTCGYKGVTFCKKNNKYHAQIVKLKKHYYLGSFNTAEEAHKAYYTAAKKLHGEFAQVA